MVLVLVWCALTPGWPLTTVIEVDVGAHLPDVRRVIILRNTLTLRTLVLRVLVLILNSELTLFNWVVVSNVLTRVRVVILLLELFLTFLHPVVLVLSYELGIG